MAHNNEKLIAVIVDIDGTLADISHRKHYVEGDKKDWDKFKEETKNDTENYWCSKIVKLIQPHYYIFFVSGRNESQRMITLQQIREWTLLDCDDYELYMRKDDDFRPDTELKMEIFKEKIDPSWEVEFVIDDRKCVVDMWRSLGLVTLQCAKGDY